MVKSAQTGAIEIVPLGGLGEFGLNMMAYRLGNTMVVVDAGLLFPTHDTPGVDVIVPDTSYLDAHRSIFKGVVLTHGHEDHIGALAYLLRNHRVPVYGTRLTLGIVRRRLEEHGLLAETDLRDVVAGESIRIGDFDIEFIQVAHSLADSVALAIATPMGFIVHTGDFKIDDGVPVGPPTNLKRFAELGRRGVLCLLSDSTNSEVNGRTGSESSVTAPLDDIVKGAPGRVLVCCFASSTHRLQVTIDLAAKHDRKVVLTGRSMIENVMTAVELGYLRVPHRLLWLAEDADKLPAREQLIIASGSQGEPGSALSSIAQGSHRHVALERGDRVILSARVIPGNERAVNRVINQLFRTGVDVYYPPGSPVHVSGHGSGEDLRMLLDVVKPEHFVPIHGEWRQLYHHARIARESGVNEQRVFIVENGDVLRFEGKGGYVSDKVDTGLALVDASGLGLVDDCVVRDRRRLAGSGVVVPFVLLSENEPIVSDILSRGFIDTDEGESILTEAQDFMLRALNERSPSEGDSERAIEELVQATLRRFFRRKAIRRPVILPVVVATEGS
ncbi:MAG TPA: ribonuclease J [Vicinamibacteria bacterium]|nr:ribonuclease J [Vicinamibacteria bacterium]